MRGTAKVSLNGLLQTLVGYFVWLAQANELLPIRCTEPAMGSPPEMVVLVKSRGAVVRVRHVVLNRCLAGLQEVEEIEFSTWRPI